MGGLDALDVSTTQAPWAPLPPTPPLEPVPAPHSTVPPLPPPGGGAPPTGPADPAPRRRRSGAGSFGASLLAGVVIAAVVTGAVRLPHGLRPTLDAAPVTTSAPAATSTAAAPSDPTSAAAIAEAVNASIVDVNTTLGARAAGAGTGMIIARSGLVLTNYHVIDGAKSIRVRLVSTGRSYPATVVGTDPGHDVAVIKISGVTGLQPIPIGDSSEVAIGDGVVAIGNALGSGGSPEVATGTVTGLNRTVVATDEDGSNAETLTGLIETSAPLLPGYSGGPLLNLSGEVIGIDTAASAGRRFRSTAAEAGLAIPINQALAIARQLSRTG